jgi:hypothetical protein
MTEDSPLRLRERAAGIRWRTETMADPMRRHELLAYASELEATVGALERAQQASPKATDH